MVSVSLEQVVRYSFDEPLLLQNQPQLQDRHWLGEYLIDAVSGCFRHVLRFNVTCNRNDLQVIFQFG